MSRYFFHVLNGKAVLDDAGSEFPSLDVVRKEAIRAAGSMLSAGELSWNGDAWQMVVCDETGSIVFGVSFSVDRHGL